MINILELNGAIYIENNLIINLSNISFKEKQIYIINGQNGVGKSSFCNGLFKAPGYQYDGTINIKDNQIDLENRLHILMQNKIFYIPQYIPQVNMDDITYRNLWDGMQRNFKYKFNWDIINQYTSLAQEKQDYMIGSCSGGENKIMELIPYLTMPNMNGIILDEVDSSLDQENVTLVKNIIKSFNQQNMFIVMISHHLDNWSDLSYQLINIKDSNMSIIC